MRYLFVVTILLCPRVLFADAKHIILMISDGAGFNTFDAAAYYQYGRLGVSPYNLPQQGHSWIHFACKTHLAGGVVIYSNHTVRDTTKSVGYNSTDAWDTTPTQFVFPQPGFTDPNSRGAFAGYNYLKAAFTDSAAAATAIATGHKSMNTGPINWDNAIGKPISPTIAERAKQVGKKVGVVTSVMFSDATPAALGGVHNPSRNDVANSANQMLDGKLVDVLMGCGHPGYTNNGTAIPPTCYDYVGGQNTWEQLESQTHPGGWNLIQEKEDFEALANGTYSGDTKRVLGVPRVGRTLQANRDRDNPPNPSVPTLETMSRAALNLLNNPNGFFLLIEGGAVDLANHRQRLDRMVEEQVDFTRSIEAVIDWIHTHSNWDETLLIITADHECGLVWGPHSDTIPFDPIVNYGAGVLPGAAYNSNDHTNSLVPLFALGYGADRLARRVDGTDPVRGPYIDNTDIFTVMNGALCSYVIAGDLNSDCRVDVSDLSILVEHWLIDCHQNPSDLACIPNETLPGR